MRVPEDMKRCAKMLEGEIDHYPDIHRGPPSVKVP